MRATGFVTSFDCDDLTGQSSRNLVLACSYHPSPGWGPQFLQNSKVKYFPAGRSRTLSCGCSGVSCPPLLIFLHYLPPSLISSCLNLALWNSGRFKECEHTLSSVQQLILSDPMDCSTPGLPVHHQLWSLLKLMSIESVMPSNHLILCRPLLLLPSIFLSIRVFSNESALHIRQPKYWSFSFNISPSNEYSGLISFRMDWLDLLAVPGTLKSLLQHHSSEA